jgi:hypothetical protein
MTTIDNLTNITELVSNLLPTIEYPTFHQFVDAYLNTQEYIINESSYLSSSTCGMIELYLDYCRNKNNNYVNDFDRRRRVYLSRRSACDNIINLVRWFEGNTEAILFRNWMYQN